MSIPNKYGVNHICSTFASVRVMVKISPYCTYSAYFAEILALIHGGHQSERPPSQPFGVTREDAFHE